jgi:acetyltransferase-like isoleucine patch superfamily enzyme
MEENLSKKDKIHLLLIDNLAIALILIFVGFWVNSRLVRIEKRHETELSTKNQEFILYRDSIGRVYEERLSKLNSERELLERIRTENREDLLRSEEQLFNQRLKELELIQSIRLERIKTDISIEAQLNESSIEYISMAWEKVNQIDLGSEVLTYNHLVKIGDGTMIVDGTMIGDGIFIESGDTISLENNELIEFNRQLTSLKSQIIDAEKYINQYRFWLGEKQRNLMIKFLKLNMQLIDHLEKEESEYLIMRTKREIESNRQDIYNYRDELFNTKL